MTRLCERIYFTFTIGEVQGLAQNSQAIKDVLELGRSGTLVVIPSVEDEIQALFPFSEIKKRVASFFVWQ